MDFSDIASRLQTVISIPVTPFAEDVPECVDWPAFRRNIERQIDNGITVLTPNGNTSEYFSLTARETIRACRESLAAARADTLIMPGVGHDLQTACQQVQAMAALGVQAVMIHQPIHPFVVNEGWVAYHQAIARSAPDVAFTCYLRNPRIGARELRVLAETCPNFAGVKYAVPDVVAFAEAAQALASYPLALICGVAETWAPFFWTAGARGFTSGLVNVTATLPLAMQQALMAQDGPRAMEIWHRIRPFEQMRGRDQNALNVSVVKEALHQMGFAARTVRPPLAAVPEAERAQIGTMLRSFGLHPAS